MSGSPWHYKNISGDLIGLGINFFMWSILLIVIETGCGRKIKELIMDLNKNRFPAEKQSLDIDPDVTEEAKRVAKTDDKDLQIKVTNLRKVYLRGSGPCNPGKPLCAVENLSFGLQKGECFALLGVNGAGKSTTFKILTAEEEATSGSIKIQGMDMIKDFQKCRKLIGYCPQYNPLFDTLSVYENIDYFSRIKGIPYNCRYTLIESVIEQLGLQIHRNKCAGDLSGGNKRKLSVAIAIVGNPPIILLDEPSAGMDPEARRFMWEVVGRIAAKKTSAVILTSHLMEEAEALSSKMGIMVKGGIFKCFGTSQHIKNKFGVGFEVEVKIKVPDRKKLLDMTMKELSPFCVDDPEFQKTKRLRMGATLWALATQTGLSQLECDLIRKELVIHFKQAQEKVENIEYFESDIYQFMPAKDVLCPATIFMEKLNTTRNLFGTI